MVGFKPALNNELFKLRKKKKVVASGVLAIIAVIIGQLAISLINNKLGLLVVSATELPLLVLKVLMYTLFPMFITFIVIDMFSSEFNNNTIKLTLTNPASRFTIFSAKIAAILVFIAINLAFVYVISLICGVIFKFSSVSIEGIFTSLLAYVVSVLPLLLFALFVVLLANVIKSGITVFFVTILIYIAFFAIDIVFNNFSSFLFTSHLDWYTLWISTKLNLFKIFRLTLIMVGCSVMLFTGGYMLFERKGI